MNVLSDSETQRAGQRVHIAVSPRGVLARLRDLSAALEREYGWSPDQAVAFVLADAIPIVSILRVTTRIDYPRGHRVVLDVDPETDPALVEREYRRARAQLLGDRIRPALPHTFEAALAGVARAGTWKNAWKLWRREHDVFEDERAFRTAARSGLRTLARSRPWVEGFEDCPVVADGFIARLSRGR